MWNLDERSPNEPLTDEVVEDAEILLGVSLPFKYVEALRVKNGGSILGDYVRVPPQAVPKHLEGFVGDGYVGIDRVNGIGTSPVSICRPPHFAREWGLPTGLILLDGDGHAWIAFDYRQSTSAPPIVFVDSHSGDSLFIAEDFGQFFGSLVRHEELYDEEGEFIA